jgi:hypothetical protein
MSYRAVAQSVSIHTCESERSDAVAGVVDEIAGNLNISTGEVVRVTVVTSATGHHLVVAAHGLAVDNRSLHTILDALSRALLSSDPAQDGDAGVAQRSASSVVDVAAALNELAQAGPPEEAAAVFAEIDETTTDGSTVPDVSDVGGESPRWIDVSAEADCVAVEQAFARMVRRSASEADSLPTVFDVDADLRLLGDTGHRDAVGWWATTAPAIADRQIPDESVRSWYMLRRFGTRTGRAQGKKAAGRQMLLTRSHGESARPSEPEAVERFYRIVFRYQLLQTDNGERLSGQNTVRLGVVGRSDKQAQRWLTEWAGEIAGGGQQ